MAMNRFAAVAVFTFLCSVSAINAKTVTFVAKGEIIDRDGAIEPNEGLEISVGDDFETQFTFDLSTVARFRSSTSLIYDHEPQNEDRGYRVSVGGFNYELSSADETMTVYTENDHIHHVSTGGVTVAYPPRDSLWVSAWTAPIEIPEAGSTTQLPFFFSMRLTDWSATAFSSTDLPTSLSAANFSSAYMNIVSSRKFHYFGEIHSIEVVTIPEPTSFLAWFAMGAVAVVRHQRRR